MTATPPYPLEPFQAKWSPVRVKKMRQNNDLEHFCDSMKRRNALDVHVGTRLRRQQVRLTQSDLATALGITAQQVQKYERGTNRIAASTLYRLAETLRTPMAFFFADAGAGQSPPEAETPPLDPDEHALLRTFRAIKNPDIRHHLAAIVQALADGKTRPA